MIGKGDQVTRSRGKILKSNLASTAKSDVCGCVWVDEGIREFGLTADRAEPRAEPRAGPSDIQYRAAQG